MVVRTMIFLRRRLSPRHSPFTLGQNLLSRRQSGADGPLRRKIPVEVAGMNLEPSLNHVTSRTGAIITCPRKHLWLTTCVLAGIMNIAAAGQPPLANPVSAEVTNAALPPLKLDQAGPVGSIAFHTQVIARANSLGLNLGTAMQLASSSEADTARLNILTRPHQRSHVVLYTGTTLSGIVSLLAPDTQIIVTSPTLLIDEPLTITTPHVTLTLGQTHLSPALAWANAIANGHSKAVLAVQNTSDVFLDGGIIDGAEGVLLSNAAQSAVTGLTVKNAPGYGVVIASGSHDIVVASSHFTGLAASGVAILPWTREVLVEDNSITGGTGLSNEQAGILVTARMAFTHIGGPNFLLGPKTLPDGHTAYQFPPDAHVTSFTHPPRNVLLVSNSITGMLANGIYLDGAVLTYAEGNHIQGNSKEGMCLDNGSTANVVVGNEIAANGERWGQSDDDLRLDFVLQFGRMPDGTANAKLPGISIDNAAFNIIMDNHVADNGGSGIKMVRSSFYNLVGRNLIADNNTGANKVFFFFGIELGGAPGDVTSRSLDFAPSIGNIIFQNIIAGAHHSGIQFCPACAYNDVFDNMIIRPGMFALEQTAPHEANIFSNNFSQAPSRNADLNSTYGRVLLGGPGIYDGQP
ncbi:MAG: hypothetical protein B7Z77_09855 [Acidocella sp. 20-58-15]|nr:MAG: hypothetical protein B7Z77_09855 [Acidocella sp. 20-58-15]